MNSIEITLERIDFPDWLEEYRAFLYRLLEQLGISNWEVSVLLCDGEMIRKLNSSYRNKNEITDVLSFPQGGADKGVEGDKQFTAGDIVIAVDRIAEQAADFGVSFSEELYRMSVHGILHLAGDHHDTSDTDEPMLKKQEEILSRLMREGKD